MRALLREQESHNTDHRIELTVHWQDYVFAYGALWAQSAHTPYMDIYIYIEYRSCRLLLHGFTFLEFSRLSLSVVHVHGCVCKIKNVSLLVCVHNEYYTP